MLELPKGHLAGKETHASTKPSDRGFMTITKVIAYVLVSTYEHNKKKNPAFEYSLLTFWICVASSPMHVPRLANFRRLHAMLQGAFAAADIPKDANSSMLKIQLRMKGHYLIAPSLIEPSWPEETLSCHCCHDCSQPCRNHHRCPASTGSAPKAYSLQYEA